MNEDRQKIIDEIDKELDYANGKWGTEFDDKNTINDWAAYIQIYVGQAVRMGSSKEEQKKQLTKAAGLAISALEAFERNGGFPPRHYDK